MPWDPLIKAENSESDDNSSFTEFFVTNSHSISDNLNNSEEDGLSDIVDAPKENQEFSISSSENEPNNMFASHYLGIKTSPKKQIKRNMANIATKRLVIDKTASSSLQKYFLNKKNQLKDELFAKNLEEKQENCTESEENPENIKKNNEAFAENIMKKQKLLIVTVFLPLKLNILEQKNGEISWEVHIETRDFYSNLLTSLLKSQRDFLWLGVLNASSPIPFDKQENLRQFLCEKYCCFAIFYDFCDLQKIKEDFFLGYFDASLTYSVPRNSSKFYNYDEQLYSQYYKGLLRIFAGEVATNLKNFPEKSENAGNLEENQGNPAVFILSYELFGLPALLRASNQALKLLFYWPLSFVNEENFTSLPFAGELLSSLLSCDMLIFSTFQEAKSFFTVFREKTGLDYYSANGLLFIVNLAKITVIRLAPGFLDFSLFSQASQLFYLGFSQNCSVPREKLYEIYWKEALEGFEIVVSLDDSDRNPQLLLLKLKLMETLLGKPINSTKKLRFFELYSAKPALNADFSQRLRKKIKEINEKAGYEAIFLVDTEVPEVLENILLENARFLLEMQVYETSLAKIQRFISLSKRNGVVLVPKSFENWIFVHTSRFLSFHTLSPEDFSVKVTSFLEDSREIAEDRTLLDKNPLCWLDAALKEVKIAGFLRFDADFSRKSRKNWRNTVEPLRMPEKKPFYLLKKPRNCEDLGKSQGNRAILLGLEEVLLHKDAYTFVKEDFEAALRKVFRKPSESLLETLQKLAIKPGNCVYIISSLGIDLLGPWAVDFENLGLACEYGFLHKDPNAKNFQRLFEMDWNWKDIVKKIMENYCSRTPGSLLYVKEACVVWDFKNADSELGDRQASSLISHLNEVFENNSEIQVIRGEKTVEARPFALNKSTCIEILLEKTAKERGLLDNVWCFVGTLGDEEMLEGLERSFSKKKADIFVNFFTLFFIKLLNRAKTQRFTRVLLEKNLRTRSSLLKITKNWEKC